MTGRLGLAVSCLLLASAALCVQGSATDYDLEIRALAERDDVRRAIQRVRALEADNVARLIELTEVAAPPFGEQARGAGFAAMLRDAGIGQVEVDAVGNVIGRWDGDGRDDTLAVVAHLDTVFPAGTELEVRSPDPEPGQHRRWYAPGIADNTRGLILLATLAECMVDARLETRSNILFVGSVGEEGLGDLRGVKHLLRAGGPRIDQLIAIDGGNDGRVLNQAIGSHRYRVLLQGPGGHSWGAFGLANPAHALASAIHAFDEQARLLVATGPRTTYNIGRIGGGTSVNSVPFEAWAEVDLRSAEAGRLEAIDTLLQQTVRQAVEAHNERRDRGAALEASLTLIGDRPSGLVGADTPLIQRAMAATRYLGVEPELGSGSTDANVAIAAGIPATTISRGGRSGNAHSLNEWWSDEAVEVGTIKALLLILAAAGLTTGEQSTSASL